MPLFGARLARSIHRSIVFFLLIGGTYRNPNVVIRMINQPAEGRKNVSFNLSVYLFATSPTSIGG